MEISEKFNSRIYILNVQRNHNTFSPEKAIGKMKTSEAFSNKNHQFLTIYENKVTEGISKFIRAKDPDILAMVAHRHGFVERLFGKIHTKEMSYQTQIPLLILQSK